MYLHANAKLGLSGRVSLVRAIEQACHCVRQRPLPPHYPKVSTRTGQPQPQRAQTTQLARRPTTHQPRPQRPKAGHLAAGEDVQVPRARASTSSNQAWMVSGPHTSNSTAAYDPRALSPASASDSRLRRPRHSAR
jgi:hypothetical protein